MPFIATLQLGDSIPLKVLNCDWQFTQMVDMTCKPVSIPKGGLIHITVQADGSDFLFNWMTNPILQKKGTLTFCQPDGIKELKTVAFEDALCVGYLETFDYLGISPQQIHLTISARVFIMGSTTYTNNWPEAYGTSCSEQSEN